MKHLWDHLTTRWWYTWVLWSLELSRVKNNGYSLFVVFVKGVRIDCSVWSRAERGTLTSGFVFRGHVKLRFKPLPELDVFELHRLFGSRLREAGTTSGWASSLHQQLAVAELLAPHWRCTISNCSTATAITHTCTHTHKHTLLRTHTHLHRPRTEKTQVRYLTFTCRFSSSLAPGGGKCVRVCVRVCVF